MPPTRTNKKSKTTQPAVPSSPLDHPTLRTTPTHIIFHGGLLSQWHPCPTPFAGATALSHTLPRLTTLSIPHPPAHALTTRLLSISHFARGEQWMMALKAWLFERDTSLSESDTPLSEQGLSDLHAQMLSPTSPEDPARATLWASSMCRILRTNMPRAQKALGRRVRGFDEEVWRTASVAVVVGGCVARAGVDPALRAVYRAAAGRTFVEGSPRDRVWGVGLRWDGREVEDEKNWRGENRLGVCHGIAAEIVRSGAI
ncbi:swarming motility protein YbiA like protein [Aspergillus terreus]|uniref:Swarming motility protein YbiA like protein n=1 Tax=Aspergillus terreus TaxID=33178 RepID=A0A5M3YNA1_ASPTE|nr:hypothetical protein ATETN484_0002008400 [Aspergillus terreus]GFF13733.1 swarming motility protein YbiA like protein [Aspergillus terreus]